MPPRSTLERLEPPLILALRPGRRPLHLRVICRSRGSISVDSSMLRAVKPLREEVPGILNKGKPGTRRSGVLG